MMSGEPGAADPQIQVEVAIDEPGRLGHREPDDRPGRGRGREFLPAWAEACAPAPGRRTPPRSDACFDKLADEGYRQQVEYQPASRFWALQWSETGILLVLAAGLAGFCFWRIRRDFT